MVIDLGGEALARILGACRAARLTQVNRAPGSHRYKPPVRRRARVRRSPRRSPHATHRRHPSRLLAVALVSARRHAAARPRAQQGNGVHRGRARRARAEGAAAAARLQPGRAGRARARQLPPPARPAREVHLHGGAARPQRGAVLPHRHREPRRDDADHLHADRRARMPEVRPHLPAPARDLRHAPTTAARSSRCCATGRTATSR